MTNSKTSVIMIAMFLVLSSSMAVIITAGGENSDAETIDYTDWIKISTPEDLSKIGTGGSYPVDGKYVLTSDINFKGKDLNGGGSANGNMDPLSPDGDFIGTFHGDGHKIIGLILISSDSSGYTSFGLFAKVGEGVVLDGIGLEGGSTTIESSDTEAGSLVGYAESLTMTNCYNTGDITVTGSMNAYVGGLISYATSLTMTNCYNTGDITITISSTSHIYAGGLIGYNDVSPITITDSYNTGDITTKTTGETTSYIISGGLVAYSDSSVTMTNCYNMGDLTATAANADVGGLVAYSDSSVTMTNCYNAGDITATVTSSSYAHAGGLVVYTSSVTMTNCYNAGDIKATSSLSDAYAGGLVVYTYSVTMTNCYNAGDITVTVASSSYACAGGLVAEADELMVTNCYSAGDIKATSSSDAYAGGLIGNVYSSAMVTNCYFSGSASDSIGNGIENVLFDGGISSRENPSGKLSFADLQNEASYYSGITDVDGKDVEGWDFTEIWYIDGTKKLNSGLPYLRVFDIPDPPSGDNMMLYIGIGIAAAAAIGIVVYFLFIRKT